MPSPGQVLPCPSPSSASPAGNLMGDLMRNEKYNPSITVPTRGPCIAINPTYPSFPSFFLSSAQLSSALSQKVRQIDLALFFFPSSFSWNSCPISNSSFPLSFLQPS
ncbi:hypothetical protein I7I53_05452 [Histoplasma capsulatum var. duboisii H88]|uniref:Uncharacterized protein n=1 Tax=Ajellomyces capsulatus (strain H88) TaxID=544711 RepID=A0A8A1LUW8_AJEC8|nr:hypothetical protein I7I53_05452 [Histoplasma capsulatum var. duboisii H88]